MLGSPCSQCCGSCEPIFQAEAVELTVRADDVYATEIRKVYYSDCGLATNQKYAVASFFKGSAFAGTFSLTKTVDLSYRKVWQYNYPAGGQVCAGDYLQITVDRSEPPDTWVYLRCSLSQLFWTDFESETPLPAEAFGCSTTSTNPYRRRCPRGYIRTHDTEVIRFCTTGSDVIQQNLSFYFSPFPGDVTNEESTACSLPAGTCVPSSSVDSATISGPTQLVGGSQKIVVAFDQPVFLP